MTSGNNDPEEWNAIIGNDRYKKELEIAFKDNNSPLKIVIVIDMWLTGFDVPSLSTIFAVKLLRKLIDEQVRIYQRTKAVRAEKFSAILSDSMSNYLKGMLTNEEVINELLNMWGENLL